jgi:hypothetical protein
MSEIPAKSRVIKAKFTREEDDIILEEVACNGPRRWKKIAARLPNRTARTVRERYKNYLSPVLSNKEWTIEEDAKLLSLVETHGQKWVSIVCEFPGRTDVGIKNRYNNIKTKPLVLPKILPTIAPPIEEGVSMDDISSDFSCDFDTSYDEYFHFQSDEDDNLDS